MNFKAIVLDSGRTLAAEYRCSVFTFWDRQGRASLMVSCLFVWSKNTFLNISIYFCPINYKLKKKNLKNWVNKWSLEKSVPFKKLFYPRWFYNNCLQLNFNPPKSFCEVTPHGAQCQVNVRILSTAMMSFKNNNQEWSSLQAIYKNVLNSTWYQLLNCGAAKIQLGWRNLLQWHKWILQQFSSFLEDSDFELDNILYN